jgi:Flp pilus assembly protein TadG
MKKILKFKRNTEGQSLVEFALVLPILMVLILGMIEFGWVLNGKITLTSAAREGARVAVIYESAEQASTAVQSAVTRSAESSSLTLVTTVTTFDEPTKSAVINVNAKIKPIIGLFFSGDVTLSAKAEMRIE